MDRSPLSYRNIKTKTPTKSDIYSTVIIHSNSDSDSDSDHNPDELRRERATKDQDLYATMVYKDVDKRHVDDQENDDDDDDDSSLPPLLKRLPKDFGGGALIDYEDDDDGFDDDAGDFGTMIVKTERNRVRNRSSDSVSKKPRGSPSPFLNFKTESPGKRGNGSEEEDEDEEGDGDGYSTFVVRSRNRESESGTVVRRTDNSRSLTRDGSGRFEGSTMDRAVASMQGMGELGFGGRQRKGNGSPSSEEGGGRRNKVSSSSIPESITREDPNSKYELLNELGTFGTVIIHDGDENDKVASQLDIDNAEPSTASIHDESASISGSGVQIVDPRTSVNRTGDISDGKLDPPLNFWYP